LTLGAASPENRGKREGFAVGTMREVATGRLHVLDWEHVVGRGGPPACSLTLDDHLVSGIHAAVRWTGSAWEVKDLGSRNGTFVDGRRLDVGASAPLRDRSRVAFGRLDREWELVDARTPRVMVVPIPAGEPLFFEQSSLSLPSNDDARASVYLDTEGTWTLERSGGLPSALQAGEVFDVDGRLYRLACPRSLASTAIQPDPTEGPARPITDAELTFSVSRDEEFVHVRVAVGSTEIDVGESVYNYLLLTLARRRVADAAAGFAETSCGWVDRDVLARDPTMGPQNLNLAVHRLRDQFSRAGIDDSTRLIERRTSTRQLRIGTGRLKIIQL